MPRLSWKFLVVLCFFALALPLNPGWDLAQAAPVQQEPPKLNTGVVTGTLMLPGRAIVDAHSRQQVVQGRLRQQDAIGRDVGLDRCAVGVTGNDGSKAGHEIQA